MTGRERPKRDSHRKRKALAASAGGFRVLWLSRTSAGEGRKGFSKKDLPSGALHWAKTVEGALAYLEKGNIDAVVFDLSSSNGVGLEGLTSLRAQAPGVPIIALVESGNALLASEALRRGAQDVLAKGDLDEETLLRTIRCAQKREAIASEQRNRYAHLERILSAVSSILIEVDLTERVTYWNAVAESILGIAKAQVIGSPLASCALAWDFEEIRQGLSDCREKDSTVRLKDVAFKRPDGNGGVVGMTISPVKDAAGKRQGFLILGADVTLRRRDETVLSQQRAALQQRAHVFERRNRQLTEQQQIMRSLLADLHRSKEEMELQKESLEQANRRLRDMGVVKDEFVAKVSHELRTPLTSIKEGLSLMLDGALGETTDDQKDFLQTMDADIDRLTELINNMLDLSKIEAGRMRLSRARLSLPELLESLVKSHRPLLAGRAIEMRLEPVPPVFADANRLMQVFTNLLSNAIKYTPEGGKITLRTESGEGMVAIRVEDTGPGIAEEEIPKLFKKFSQVGPQGAARPRGTGLGLAVCKELVELHRGHIEVASELGQGSTFSVKLPIYSQELALSEALQELLDLAPFEADKSISVVVVQADEVPAEGAAASGPERAENLADQVKRRLHRGDIVLPLSPALVAIFAILDEAGLKAVVQRLREVLPNGKSLQFGAARYPKDGKSGSELLARAQERLGSSEVLSDGKSQKGALLEGKNR